MKPSGTCPPPVIKAGMRLQYKSAGRKVSGLGFRAADFATELRKSQTRPGINRWRPKGTTAIKASVATNQVKDDCFLRGWEKYTGILSFSFSFSCLLACLLRGLGPRETLGPKAYPPARSAHSSSEGPLFGAEKGVPPNAQSRTQPPKPRLRPSPLQDQCIVAIRVIRSLSSRATRWGHSSSSSDITGTPDAANHPRFHCCSPVSATAGSSTPPPAAA